MSDGESKSVVLNGEGVQPGPPLMLISRSFLKPMQIALIRKMFNDWDGVSPLIIEAFEVYQFIGGEWRHLATAPTPGFFGQSNPSDHTEEKTL